MKCSPDYNFVIFNEILNLPSIDQVLTDVGLQRLGKLVDALPAGSSKKMKFSRRGASGVAPSSTTGSAR
jgi:hypothetical protein